MSKLQVFPLITPIVVRVFIVLLAGVFCYLGFSGVFFCCLGGAVFFLLFGRGRGPRPNSTKKHAPAQTAKKNTPLPRPSVFFFFFFVCAVWAGGRVYVFAVWAGGVFFAVWAMGVFFFAV